MHDLNPENWVKEYGDYLYGYAYSRMRDANAAEEVLQETLLAGVKYSGQYAGKGSVRGWLIAILKRKIIDYFRARKKHAGASLSDDDDAFDPRRCCLISKATGSPARSSGRQVPKKILR